MWPSQRSLGSESPERRFAPEWATAGTPSKKRASSAQGTRGGRRSSGLRVPARTARPFCDTRAQAGSFFSLAFGAHAPYLNLARLWEMCRESQQTSSLMQILSEKPFYIHQKWSPHISKGPYSPGSAPSCRHPSADPSVWLEQFPEQKVLCSIRGPLEGTLVNRNFFLI